MRKKSQSNLEAGMTLTQLCIGNRKEILEMKTGMVNLATNIPMKDRYTKDLILNPGSK